MRSRWVLIFFLLFLYSCQKVRVTRELQDGVEIIKYNKLDSWLPTYELQLQEVFTISGYQDDEFIPFGNLSDLMIDEEDNIYSAERRVSKIHKFSRNGEYIKSCGRQGKGPEESVSMGGLFQYDDFIFVHSQNPNKLIKWTKNLEFVETITFQKIRPTWIYRDQTNHPILFGTLGQVRQGAKNPYDFSWIRSFHTLKFMFDVGEPENALLIFANTPASK